MDSPLWVALSLSRRTQLYNTPVFVYFINMMLRIKPRASSYQTALPSPPPSQIAGGERMKTVPPTQNLNYHA